MSLDQDKEIIFKYFSILNGFLEADEEDNGVGMVENQNANEGGNVIGDRLADPHTKNEGVRGRGRSYRG